MKKWTILLSSSLLAIALATPAVAASASAPIQVVVDGQSLQFTDTVPYSSNNTVFVPFRAIFQELGLQVEFESKTQKVTGKRDGLKIELTIGSRSAKVNGKVQTLTAAPVIKNNTVFVPLRFIGQAAGAEVYWNADSSTVEIDTPEAKEQAKADVTALILQMIQDYSNENVTAYLSTFDFQESNPTIIQGFFDESDISITSQDLEFVELDSDEAVVDSTEISKWVGGAYFPDTVDTYEYDLYKVDGVWKVSELTLGDSAYMIPDLSKTITVPADKAAAVSTVLDAYDKALNHKDWNGVLATFVPYTDPELEAEDAANYQDVFNSNTSTDLKLFKQQFLYSSDTTVAIYTERTATYADGSTELYKTVFELQKASTGAWLIEGIYNLYE